MSVEDNHLLMHDTESPDDEFTIELESDPLQSTLLAKRSLVGKIISQKPLNRVAVKSILIKAWENRGEFQITDMGKNMFLFSFGATQEVLEIIKKGPWYIMGHLLSLQFWVPDVALYEVMEVENPKVEGRLVRTYFRVRALINITKPLVTGCWVPRKNLPKVWIFFKYERLQGLCFNCGVVGHEQKACGKPQVISHLDGKVPKYNAKLGVAPAKPILQLFQEQGHWSNKMKKGEEGNQEGHNTDSGGAADPMPHNPCNPNQDHGGPTIPNPAGTSTIPTQHCQNSQHKEMVEVMADKDMQKEPNVRKEQPQQEDAAGTEKVRQNQTFYYELSSVYCQLGQQLLWPQIMGPTAHGKNKSPSPSITKVDLKEGKWRPGLGPDDISSLGLTPEFYGPQKERILLDYPSPEGNETLNDERKGKQSQTPYFVEFPDEEDNNDPPTTPKATIHQEEESQLIVGWNQALTLKRNRDAFAPTDGGTWSNDQEEGSLKRQKKLEWKTGAVIEGTLDDLFPILMGDKLWEIAEEAGHNLPHPHQ
ncbi:Zinc finger, CCHC-type [Sesbania bispinosa]|nr:Zinc finger, CCHC-type [Sesbania bispinosa]